MAYFVEYLLLANIICFVAFGIDKIIACCKIKWQRIPEKNLFGLIMLGPFGGLIGMIFWMHKTRKIRFWIQVIFCCCLHLFLFAQLVQKKYDLMMNPGSLGINGIETPTNNINNPDILQSQMMDSIDTESADDLYTHPEL